MIEKEICLKFASVKISNFNHITGLSVIYHDQINIMIMEQKLSGNNKYFENNFHLMKHFG